MFTWTQKYSVGVEEMDAQHQQFLGLANEVLDLVEQKNISQTELMTMLSKFLDYALYHLKSEEDYFKEFDCPPPGHIEAHDRFREEFNRLFQATRNAAPDSVRPYAESAANFAGYWLLEHILVMDKGYTACFKEHGLP
jgi:hemerythrin